MSKKEKERSGRQRYVTVLSAGPKHNTDVLSSDLRCLCCPVWTMMSLLPGELATPWAGAEEGDMHLDAKSTLWLRETILTILMCAAQQLK